MATPTDPAPVDVEGDPAARGALYGLLASAFEPPDGEMYAALADGSFEATAGDLLDRTGLDVVPTSVKTDDDHDTLAARYNDLFAIGYAEYEDRTDGTLATTEPPVSLYESSYRTEASWGDVNLDLARAYDYFGLAVDEEEREHHDHLRLELEFAGYLARREAAGEEDTAAARLDFLDRHLRVLVESIRERIDDEPGPGVYADLAALLDAFTAADRADLADREGEA